MEEDRLYCPHCGSSQLVANKKGFGAGKAVAGALLTGGVGLLAGFIGSGKVKVTCLKCGCKWNAGELRTTPLPPKKEVINNTNAEEDGCATALGVIVVIAIIIFGIAMCTA